MTHGSLFSGIGGFDLAAEWMGWENKFHCEWNEFGKKVLKHYWPEAISYGDIDETDFTIWRGLIDVLSGGFPCQPYSQAGKRKGKEDERHKWPQFLRAIKEIQPGWVVGENVLGLVNWSGGLVFHEVQTDLEAAGYEVWPYVLPACAKDAPHRRDRIWFIAHNSIKFDGWAGWSKEADGCGRQAVQHEQNGRKVWNRHSSVGESGIIANTSDQGLQGSKVNGSIGSRGPNWNEQLTGLLQPNWQKFPTQSPLCSGNDGLLTGLAGITVSKHRIESIKAYGNSIVPQVAFEIFKAIEQYENIRLI